MTNAVDVDEFDAAFPSKDIGMDSKTLVFDVLSKNDVGWANNGFIKIWGVVAFQYQGVCQG